MARVFKRLSVYGFEEVNPHDLRPGDFVRVEDDTVVQSLASNMLNGDSQIYKVNFVQKNVNVAVGTGNGPQELAISFTD
jgi:hypothetical protein